MCPGPAPEAAHTRNDRRVRAVAWIWNVHEPAPPQRRHHHSEGAVRMQPRLPAPRAALGPRRLRAVRRRVASRADPRQNAVLVSRREPMGFEIPASVRPVRDAVHAFMTERVEPAEPVLRRGGDEAAALVADLQREAKAEGLWALGHPKELGGGGLPFLDYVYVNEVQGRSEFGQLALGTYTLQDSLMLYEHATEEQRQRYLAPLVRGEISPSLAMTEPTVSSSDPTQLRTRAVLDGDEWVINGHKWFTTGASQAAYTAGMCRTGDGAPPHLSFSMILVPTDTPGYTIVRETPVLGLSGSHCEVRYEDVRVPASNLLGPRGHGFVIAQKRLGPGRIFHCMRWLGQAQRAFDLMCRR